MSVIEVRDLSKVFSVKRKQAGRRGSLRSIVKPDFLRVDAVKSISFSLEPGELLAFIGPNGAGKSTTIKMLTGILYPTGGQAQVLGLVPWRDRRKLAYKIGSVFGQKPQLWYHLTPATGFHTDGVDVLKVGTYGVKLQFDTREMPVDAVIQRLMTDHAVADINVLDPPLEEIIARIYQEPGTSNVR